MTRREPADAPRQVVVIGQGVQVMAAVRLFVGGGVRVRVITADDELRDRLAPYPGVGVTVVSGYAEMPAALPEGPYCLATEQAEVIAAISAWLPRTTQRFVLGHERHAPPDGFLRLHLTPQEIRRGFYHRLAVLRRVDRLLDLARGRERCVILCYGDPDPDAIGSAMGLAALLRSVDCPSRIRYSGDIQRYQNRLLISWLDADITRLEDGDLRPGDLVAVVDAQPGFWRDQPPRADIVIDHHPAREDTQAGYTDLRSAGATASLITEYLVQAGIPLGRKVATALLYGLTTDTDDLHRNAGDIDIAAHAALHRRADHGFLRRLDKSRIPMSILDWIAWGISHRVTYRDAVVIHFGEVPTSDVCVQTADLVLLTCGISWVVCIGIRKSPEGRRLVVVFRSDGHEVDAGRRARTAFADLGSAGGHRTMARAELPLGDESEEDTVATVVGRLFKRMRPKRRKQVAQALVQHLRDDPPAHPQEFEVGA